MAFGFDPSIILGATQTQQATPEGTLRTLADLATQRMQQQHMQAQLQDMAYKQQQARSLADIFKGQAGTFSAPLAQALARGGFGGEAADAEKQAQEFFDHYSLVKQSQAATIKTKEEGDKFLAGIPPEMRQRLGLPDTYDADAFKRFSVRSMAPDKQAQFMDAEHQRELRRDPNSPKSQFIGNLVKQFGGTLPEGMSAGDVTDPELGWLERAQANRETAATRRAMAKARGGGAASPPSPADQASMEAEADHFATTGKFLFAGKSKEALAHNRQVMALALTRHSDLDPAAAGAAYAATSHSLKEAQTGADAMDRNEGKAEADLDILQGTVKNLGLTNSKLLNTPFLKLKDMKGDPAVSAYVTARTAAISQVSKTLSANPNSVTEGVRHEAENLIKEDLTPAQFASTLNVIRQDMARNKAVMRKSVEDISARTKSRKPGAATGGNHVELGEDGGSTPARKAPPGKVHISNGKEAFYVSPEDAKAAESDGFKVVP